MTTKAKTAKTLSVLIPVLIVVLVLLIAFAALLHLQILKFPRPSSPISDPALSVPTQTVTENATVQATLPPPTSNVYVPQDFGYVGDYLTCLSGPCKRGVDVSSWQRTVDWQQVKDAGMDFAMLRLGYRGTEQGGIFADDYAQSNYEKATQAGLSVGGYFFSQAITPEEAREEARFVLNLVEDWQIELPIVYDWEYIDEEARTANVDSRTLTDCTIAFCEEIKAAGYTPMVYFNPDIERKNMFLEELTDYKFWLAMYSDEMTYPYRVDMWQYTNAGSVPGIDGNCDINILFEYEN